MKEKDSPENSYKEPIKNLIDDIEDINEIKTSENEINISNENELPNIINGLKFCIYSRGNFIIEPDLYYDNKYFFFNLNNFKDKLTSELTDILKKYEYMFSPIRNDLLKYIDSLEDRPFIKRKKKFREKVIRNIHYLFNPKEYNLIEEEKAIKLALLFTK